MAYEYGSPSDEQRPRCWSDERYHNPKTNECRSCRFQTSCRDQILRTRGYQPAAPAVATPVAPYYNQSFIPGYQVPPPGSQVPVHVAPQNQQPIQQQVVRQPQPSNGVYPAPARYAYGWLNDPMYYQMAASPPPMIPQLDEESFFERLGKNILIDGLRSLTWQLHLATRQWVWEPGQRMIESQPNPPQLPPQT
jgi:hypothetical protein